MPMKPRVAIPVPNSDAAYSARTLPEYTAAIEAAGGEAIAISLTATSSEVAQLLKSCDGILLPGSPADVDPQKYGAARDPRTAAADPRRDNIDELAIQDAHNMRKPLFGICYGLQILNVWRQGSLIQHLDTGLAHSRPAEVPEGVEIEHAAVIDGTSRLAQITGATEFTINSSHHQAIDRVGDALRVVAHSPADRVIEAVEGTAKDHWVMGVQWHPERTHDKDRPSKKIFEAFIEAARTWHEAQKRKAVDFETAKRI